MIRHRHPDYSLLAAFVVLLIFGLAMLSSASAVVGFERFSDSYYFVKRQLLATGLGIVAFIFFMHFDYRRLQRYALPIMIVSLISLLLVFLPGVGQSYGTFARRWVRLGPIAFQPSELLKLTFLIYLAAWLTKRARQVNDFRLTFLPYAVVLIAVLGLIIAQPDLGTAFVIALIAVSVYFLGGGRLAHLLILAMVGVAAFLILINYQTHTADRFKMFLHPELDPQGIGYHINQAYLAIGSGGKWGRGFGQSRAKFQYLPEAYGDSIFAVIAEELGFFAVLIMIAMLLYIFYRGLAIARAAPDDFGRLLGSGIIIWFIGQSFVNMSAMIGLLPLTGIPLPFISHGPSAMATSLAAVGILVNISKHRREV